MSAGRERPGRGPPTPSSSSPTASWYRPEDGRFSGVGDRALRALRGRLARRLDRIAPAGAGPGRGRGRRGAARRARRRRAGSASGSSAIRTGPTSARPSSRTSTGRSRRSCSGTRSSTCATPAPTLERAARLLAPGGVIVIAMPNPASLQARAVRRALARPRPAPPPGPRSRAGAARAATRARDSNPSGSAICAAARSYSAGCTASSAACPRPPRPLRRDPPARGAAGSRSRRRSGRLALSAAAVALPVAAVCAAAEAGLRRGRHRLRGGPPWLSGPRPSAGMPRPPCGQDDRRDAGAQRGEDARAHRRRDSPRRGRRGHPRRRPLHRRDARGRARARTCSVIWHPHNVGYGGNQKTCYLEALQRDADIVVMLHPDGQYEPALIPKLIEPILRGRGRPGARLAHDGRRAPRRRPGCPSTSGSPTAP